MLWAVVKTMRNLNKHFSTSSAHSVSSRFVYCPPFRNSTELQVQQSSISRSLSLKMGNRPQHCHNTEQLNFQFQDQDSPSTQSTGQSYPEVVSMQESKPCGQGIVSPKSGMIWTMKSLCFWSFLKTKNSLCVVSAWWFWGSFYPSMCTFSVFISVILSIIIRYWFNI